MYTASEDFLYHSIAFVLCINSMVEVFVASQEKLYFLLAREKTIILLSYYQALCLIQTQSLEDFQDNKEIFMQ